MQRCNRSRRNPRWGLCACHCRWHRDADSGRACRGRRIHGAERALERFRVAFVRPIVIAGAVPLLGPGAYSIDAWEFGRHLSRFEPDVDRDK